MIPTPELAEDKLAQLTALRQRRVNLSRRRVAILKQHRLRFYRPHPKQAAFHTCGKKRRMVRAGNRFGKSEMGCAEDLAWCLGYRPWLSEDDPGRTIGIPPYPVKGVVITTDWDKVNEIWTSNKGAQPGKVWKFIPADAVKSTRRNSQGVIDQIEFKRGSLLMFDTVKSFMSNPMGAESSDWDFIHVDEPCPENMFKAYARGLIDRGGSAWFTLTPLSEPWINDYFFPEDTGGQARDGVWAVDGSIYDNPYLSAEDIAEFEALLTDQEKECRLHGKPLHLAGLVYKAFDWNTHVLTEPPAGWSDFLNPPAHYPIYFNIDPHPQTPHCVLFAAVLPSGRRVYFRDIFEHLSIKDLATRIKEVTKGRRVIDARMDPLGFINDPITMSNMAEEIGRHGVHVEKASKAKEQGILLVNQELKANNILFTPHCVRALWEIRRYCWDTKDNKPVDKDDHAMECLYRNELLTPRWSEPYTGSGVDDAPMTGLTEPELELEMDLA